MSATTRGSRGSARRAAPPPARRDGSAGRWRSPFYASSLSSSVCLARAAERGLNLYQFNLLASSRTRGLTELNSSHYPPSNMTDKPFIIDAVAHAYHFGEDNYAHPA